MSPDLLRDLAWVLKRTDTRFVRVGEAAIRSFYPSEAQDVNVLLMARGYERTIRRIREAPSVVSFAREENRMATGFFDSRFRRVRFYLINPGAFSGPRSGDEFFDYVWRYGSVPGGEFRVATVAVVWFMRLAIEGDSWTAQAARILRDLRTGASWKLMRPVRRIADRFCAGPRVSERLVHLEDAARRAGLLNGIPTIRSKHALSASYRG